MRGKLKKLKTKFLGLSLAALILTGMAACGSISKATGQTTNLVVSAGYKPVISVPYCDQARKNGTITGNTYLCMVSANGDFIGAGRRWLEQPPIKNFSSGPAIVNDLYQAFIYVNSSDPSDLEGDWNVQIEPPFGQPWLVGNLYENPVRLVNAGSHGPGLSISGYGRECDQVTGKLEILEVVSVAGNPAQLDKFAANFEQFCQGSTAPLTGYIRFNATVTP
jgi:hypothetical protein